MMDVIRGSVLLFKAAKEDGPDPYVQVSCHELKQPKKMDPILNYVQV
jgi:hypothetical protein